MQSVCAAAAAAADFPATVTLAASADLWQSICSSALGLTFIAAELGPVWAFYQCSHMRSTAGHYCKLTKCLSMAGAALMFCAL